MQESKKKKDQILGKSGLLKQIWVIGLTSLKVYTKKILYLLTFIFFLFYVNMFCSF